MASEIENSYQSKSKLDDYYINPGRKIGDFSLGFFGYFLLISFLLPLFFIRPNLFSFFYSGIVISSYFLLPTIFFIIKRRYIAIGILSSILIPLLILGSCFIILAGSSFP